MNEAGLSTTNDAANPFAVMLERVRRRRLAVIATLPCASCTLRSETTKACRLFDLSGCKHLEARFAGRL